MSIVLQLFCLCDNGTLLTQHESIRNEWHQKLMTLFFQDINAFAMDTLSLEAKSDDFCAGWHGITCEGTHVRTIYYSNTDIGNFNIHALPHTAEVLALTYCRQYYSIQTRCLPSQLETLDLTDNLLYGQIDLTNLPSHLKKAFLGGNRLTGPIDFTRLPPTLLVITLVHNRIQQHTVYYDNLPKNIERIDFSAFGKAVLVSKICALNPERATKKKGVFYGIPCKNIE